MDKTIYTSFILWCIFSLYGQHFYLFDDLDQVGISKFFFFCSELKLTNMEMKTRN